MPPPGGDALLVRMGEDDDESANWMGVVLLCALLVRMGWGGYALLVRMGWGGLCPPGKDGLGMPSW